VVLDNDGGGIFSYLPPADLPEFEQLFGTPHGLDLVRVARAHGVTAERIDDVSEIATALERDDLRVIVVPIDRAKSLERHRALWDAAAHAISALR
jgi:2-succinyl-5-enolpyruvyl-6-hydroxy-3-cyclohexene-1-carboxylate synthase